MNSGRRCIGSVASTAGAAPVRALDNYLYLYYLYVPSVFHPPVALRTCAFHLPGRFSYMCVSSWTNRLIHRTLWTVAAPLSGPGPYRDLGRRWQKAKLTERLLEPEPGPCRADLLQLAQDVAAEA